MKAKITKKDGTVIELEGTAAELTPIIDPPKPQVTLTPPAKPACPGIGDKESIGKIIDELTKGSRIAPYQPQYPWTYPQLVYNDQCPMGGMHDYPTSWMSVTPPSCTKCGRSLGYALGTTVISTQTITGELVQNGTKFATSSTLPQIPFVSGFTIVSAETQS